MSEGGNKRSNMPKGFKFNLYWVYGIIALFLIGLSFMGESPRGKEISYNEIGDLVKSKAIQKINVITNKNEAEITILPEKIAEVYGKDSASMVRNPVLMLQIPSTDQFTED